MCLIAWPGHQGGSPREEKRYLLCQCEHQSCPHHREKKKNCEGDRSVREVLHSHHSSNYGSAVLKLANSEYHHRILWLLPPHLLPARLSQRRRLVAVYFCLPRCCYYCELHQESTWGPSSSFQPLLLCVPPKQQHERAFCPRHAVRKYSACEVVGEEHRHHRHHHHQL